MLAKARQSKLHRQERNLDASVRIAVTVLRLSKGIRLHLQEKPQIVTTADAVLKCARENLAKRVRYRSHKRTFTHMHPETMASSHSHAQKVLLAESNSLNATVVADTPQKVPFLSHESPTFDK